MPFVFALLLSIISIPQLQAQYTYVGSSSALGNNCYQVTPNQLWQNGAIWYNETIDLTQPFHLQFEASWGNNPAGADGMVFVMQQVGNNALGLDGGGIGFEGFSPSFGVEFDTWQNPDFGDPPFDHIAFVRNGNVNHNTANTLAGPVQALPAGTTLSDGILHVVDIFWEPTTGTFAVWLDCAPRLSANVNLVQNIFNNNPVVYWGFTAATGGASNQHRVCLDPFILGTPEGYSICNGEEVQLEANSTYSGTFNWTPAGPLSDPNIHNPIASPTETTTFTLVYSDLCGTEQTQSTTVVVYDAVAVLPPDIQTCAGESVTIVPVEITGTPAWSDGSTGATLTVTESGTYSLTATDGICSATDQINVTFSANPELNIPAQVSICEGESYTVDLSASGLSISWNDGVGGSIRTFTTAGTYAATGTAGPCSAEASITIEVKPLPTFSLGDDREECEDEPVTLTANAPNATITWNDGSTDANLNVSVSGFYEATAVLEGCTYSDAVQVIFLPVPQVAISGNTLFCGNAGTTLTATGADAYLWSNGSTTAEVTTAQGGNLSVTGTDGSSGCAGSAAVALQSIPVPGIAMAEEITKCEGRSIRLSPVLTGANTAEWSTGTTAPFIVVEEPGAYTATVANHCGEASANVQIIDEECFQNLFIPNAFTPNGDGLNDLFGVVGEGIVRFKMQIFDRWGTLVFETGSLKGTWNGSYLNSGYFCDAGVYAVRIELEYDTMEVGVQHGSVMLVR